MKYDNIFICMTPFQLFLTKKIIEIKKLKKVKVILISYFFNRKYEYYLNDLKEMNVEICFFKIENKNRTYLLLSFLKVFKFFSLKKVENIFISSIDNYFIHLLLSVIQFKNIYTFDDGVANIDYNGVFFQKKSLNFLRINSEKIKNLSKKHYTVYENHENIIDRSKVEYLSLFNGGNDLFGIYDSRNILKIFLGQPVDKIENGISSNLLNKILFDISQQDNIFYFPHPSESEKYNFLKYIETDRIFEDYILEYIPTHKIIIYTFFSSVVKNLKNYHQIEFNLIYTESLFCNFKGLYLNLSLPINVKLVKVDCEG